MESSKPTFTLGRFCWAPLFQQSNDPKAGYCEQVAGVTGGLAGVSERLALVTEQWAGVSWRLVCIGEQ